MRVGNEAWWQKQLDVLGEVVDAAHALWHLFGDRAAQRWREPDAGMWEERHYLTSKLLCWVALDRAI